MNSIEPLWTLQELCTATAGTLVNAPADATGVSGLHIDSRRLQPGHLFVALPGDLSDRFRVSSTSSRDGHDFVEAAAQSNAGAALVSQTLPDVSLPLVVVEDTVDALWALGRAARQRLEGPVVAVTGSSGKTTTKAFLRAAMGAHADEGSLNNHLGVPMSLANSPIRAHAYVYEVGTSSPGEIAPLSRLVAPDVAVVLNVHHAHIAQFQSVEELQDEKLSIAAGLSEGGILVVEDSLEALAQGRADRLVTFGESETAKVRLLSCEAGEATYRTPVGNLVAHVPGGGVHRARSLAATLAVMLALDMPLQNALQMHNDLVPGGRGDRRVVAGVTFVDDSYNANPQSMRGALHAFAAIEAERRFVVLGAMGELGEHADRHHRELIGELRDLDVVDGYWTVGEAFREVAALPSHLGWQATADQALLEHVAATLKPGDAVLIKGSNTVFWTQNFAERLRQALAG